MGDQKNALDIKTRFEAEQEYIQRYIAFLKVKAGLRDEQVREASRLLKQCGLPQLPARSDWGRIHEPYLPEETAVVVDAIERIRPALEVAITEAENRLDTLEVPERLGAVDVRSPVGEWIQYFLDALEHDSTPEAIEQARQGATQQQAQAVEEYGEEKVDVLTDEEIEYALRSGVFLLADRALASNLILSVR